MRRLVLSGLEKAINAYLRLDPDTLARCAALTDQVVKIHLTDLNITFYIIPNANGFQLTGDCSKPPQATIAGTTWGLFKIAQAKGEQTSLFENKITITGDSQIAEQFRDILSHIDIDWEEQLSKITGDIVAHQIGRAIRKTKSALEQTSHILQKNITEYLQIESQTLPTAQEVKQFITAVTQLRQDAERAEARLRRLQSRHRAQK